MLNQQGFILLPCRRSRERLFWINSEECGLKSSVKETTPFHRVGSDYARPCTALPCRIGRRERLHATVCSVYRAPI